MKYHWKMEFDKKNNKIITDEPTDEKCFDYLFSNVKERGIGTICYNRKSCINKILKEVKNNIKNLKIELKEKENVFKNFKKYFNKGE